jgi:hypothetical protein
MPNFDYATILNEFGDTLENLSADTSREREIGKVYLTSSKQKAIGFDNYVHSIAEPLVPRNRPKSCDVLIKKYETIYIKRVFIFSIDEFDKYFIKKYNL